TWTTPPRQIDDATVGHEWFPDLVSSHGALTVVFYDSRFDPAYSPSVPPGNTKSGRSSGRRPVNVVVATSEDRARTWTERGVTNVGFNPNMEVVDAGKLPFVGDYIS